MREFKKIEKTISRERLFPYLSRHHGNYEKALEHYMANIRISESFYSGISIFEVGFRNNTDLQLCKKFNSESWFDEEQRRIK